MLWFPLSFTDLVTSLSREPIMTPIRTNYFSFPTFVVIFQVNKIIENRKFENKKLENLVKNWNKFPSTWCQAVWFLWETIWYQFHFIWPQSIFLNSTLPGPIIFLLHTLFQLITLNDTLTLHLWPQPTPRLATSITNTFLQIFSRFFRPRKYIKVDEKNAERYLYLEKRNNI